MKRRLIGLAAGLVVLALAGYYVVQWQLKRSVDTLIEGLFFTEVKYQDAAIDLGGDIQLERLDVFFPLPQFAVEIDTIRVSTGSLWRSLSLRRDLQAGQWPEQLQLRINGLAFNIDRSLATYLGEFYQPDLLAEVTALGCGRFNALGPQQFYDMGFQSLTLDLGVGYEFAAERDELLASFDLFVDGMTHVRLEQTAVGVAKLLANPLAGLLNLGSTDFSVVDLKFELIDQGYNNRLLEFCAMNSGMEVAEWLSLHLSMVAEVFNSLQITTNIDLMSVYADLTDVRARTSIQLQPMAGFNLANLPFYDSVELIKLLDLNLQINDQPVRITEFSWNPENIAQLDLAKIRRDFRVSLPSEPGSLTAPEAASRERILLEIGEDQLEQYLNRTILVTRDDQETFSGELVAVQPEQIVVRSRFGTGYSDLPLRRSELISVKLYPED